MDVGERGSAPAQAGHLTIAEPLFNFTTRLALYVFTSGYGQSSVPVATALDQKPGSYSVANPGSGAFLTSGSDPGWVKNQDPDQG